MTTPGVQLLAHDGTPLPDLSAVYCRACSSVGTLTVEWRLEARPPTAASLAGVQIKTTAVEVPYATCSACRTSCRGQQ